MRTPLHPFCFDQWKRQDMVMCSGAVGHLQTTMSTGQLSSSFKKKKNQRSECLESSSLLWSLPVSLVSVVLCSSDRKWPLLFSALRVSSWLAVRIPWHPCDQFSKFYKPGRVCNSSHLVRTHRNRITTWSVISASANGSVTTQETDSQVWSCLQQIFDVCR